MPLVLLFVMFGTTSIAVAEGAEGEAVFKTNCASCHSVGKGRLVGPDLMGLHERRTEEWILQFVKNPAAFAETDADAKALIAEFGYPMPPQGLAEADVKAIITYIATVEVVEVEAKPDAAGVTTEDASGGNAQAHDEATDHVSTSTDSSPLTMTSIFIAVLILGLAYVLLKDGFSGILKNKAVKVPMILVVLSIVFGYLYDGAAGLGRSMDYAPIQPIAFSHKVHAGDNKIDCQYCHSSARQGKTSMIPSLNVCMNCHAMIKTYGEEGATVWNGEENRVGTDEIKKIYAHLGLNENGSNNPNDDGTPVAWTRIHNLPDHVYFNHSQHVVAGKQECQTCHGPVETMDVLKKVAPLSMQWCLDCHRSTDVDFTNEYYSTFKDLHEQLDKGEKSSVTVEDIGGDECQKCHY